MYFRPYSAGGYAVEQWPLHKVSVLADSDVSVFSPSGHEATIFLPHHAAKSMTVGPDGNLWVGESSYIDSVTPQGKKTEFSLPTQGAGPYQMTTGPDGAIWFTESSILGRITTSGQITEYTIGDSLAWLVSGSDGNIWVTGTYNIYRVTVDGTVTTYQLPNQGYDPGYLINGPDGAMWFAYFQRNAPYIGRLTTDGSITPYPSQYEITAFVLGPDGLIWAIIPGGMKDTLALDTFDPVSHTFGSPIPFNDLTFPPSFEMAFGSDGDLWLGGSKHQIAVYLRQAITVTPTSLTLQTNGSGTLTVAETNYNGTWKALWPSQLVNVVQTSPGVFNITGLAPGTGKVTIQDTMHNYIKIPVTVQ
jgi:virginiamycin B lyase